MVTAGGTVAVVGLGAMGSAAAYHLVKRGFRVIGFDRFAPPHDRGSSHGETRILREAYSEDPRYVPFVRRARTLWQELERATRTRLLLPTPCLIVSDNEGTSVRDAERSAAAHGLPFERFDVSDAEARFPQLAIPSSAQVGMDGAAAVVAPEAGVKAHLDEAARIGARFELETQVLGWSETKTATGASVEGKPIHRWRVATTKGTHDVDAVVVTAGPWLGRLWPEGMRLQVERQVQYWLRPKGDAALYGLGKMPLFIIEHEPSRWVYGFPDLGRGLKVAIHHEGPDADPDAVDKEVSLAEEQHIAGLVKRFLPKLDAVLERASVCLYTNTPDQHFIIGPMPGQASVYLAGGMSGHGFKFSPAVGEVLADLVAGERPKVDLSLFAPDRF